MDLHEFLHTLVQPLRVGDDLRPGLRFEGTSTELGPRLCFKSAQGAIHVEVALRKHAQRWAVARGPWALSYRSGTSDAPVDPRLGKRCCEAVAQRLPDQPPTIPAMTAAPRVREVQTRRMLEFRALGPQSHYTLSPYVGCTIGCRYCYAQTRLSPARALMGLPLVPWGSYVDVRMNAATILRAELATAKPGPIKFCPIVSDPYQALEQRYRTTRACLDVLAEAPRGFTTMLLTRSADILQDAERIAALRAARVGVSLPSADPDVLAHFEPRAAPLKKRIEVLERFSALGVPTMAVVQPMLPGPVEALADLLATHVRSVSMGGLQGTNDAAPLFESEAYRGCAEDSWQRGRFNALSEALDRRGVTRWDGELPPDLRG
ncbi:MAG: radical SAM protein, partial [Nannocystaceae bacterium]|nr:radical SAM protein [Nannocystaceae bacterium]